MTLAERRAALLDWLYAVPEREGLKTSRIATRARSPWDANHMPTTLLYGPDKNLVKRCHRDLEALARDGHVQRNGKPARWWYG